MEKSCNLNTMQIVMIINISSARAQVEPRFLSRYFSKCPCAMCPPIYQSKLFNVPSHTIFSPESGSPNVSSTFDLELKYFLQSYSFTSILLTYLAYNLVIMLERKISGDL